MKYIIPVIILLFSGYFSNAQIQTPVHWSFSAKKINPTTYEIHLTATIDQGWHTYSQSTPEGGPVPTKVTIAQNALVTTEGIAKELGKLEQHNEPLFGVNVKQFSNKLDIVQTVKLKAPVKTNVNGSVEFMVCNDHECLPPSTQKFSLAIN